jgi:hypothetical protein
MAEKLQQAELRCLALQVQAELAPKAVGTEKASVMGQVEAVEADRSGTTAQLANTAVEIEVQRTAILDLSQQVARLPSESEHLPSEPTAHGTQGLSHTR